MTPGKPGPGRTLLIYCDSPAEKDSFDKLATERGPSTSRVLLNVLREWKANIQLPPAIEQCENISVLRDRIANLEENLRREHILRERQDAEIRRLTAEPYLAEGPLQGQFPINPTLMHILRSGPVQDIALLRAMEISPQDARAVRALTRQLEALEAMGLIGKRQRGWTWLK